MCIPALLNTGDATGLPACDVSRVLDVVLAEIMPPPPLGPVIARAHDGAVMARVDTALVELVLAAFLKEAATFTNTYVCLRVEGDGETAAVEVEYDGAPAARAAPFECPAEPVVDDPVTHASRALRCYEGGRVFRSTLRAPLRTVLLVELGVPMDLPTLRLCARCGEWVPPGAPSCTRCAPEARS